MRIRTGLPALHHMNRQFLIGFCVLYSGAMAGIVFGLPHADAVHVLGWIAKIGGPVAMLALLTCMVLSPFSNSERFTQARRDMLMRLVTNSTYIFLAGFSAFIGAVGTKMIIEGHVLWGCVALGAFAVIIFFLIVAPSEI